MKKRFIAVAFLALVLVAGSLPATAFAGTGTLVTSVSISITEPAVGNTADRNPTIVSTPEVNPTCESIAWGVTSEEDYNPDDITSSNWSRLDESETFTAGKYYAFVLSLKTTEEFSTDVTVTCNGQNPVKKDVVSSGSELQLYFAFHITAASHTHSYSDVWGGDASQHWHECTDATCPDKIGSVKDLADHTFQWVVDREATTSEAGIKHEVCTVCGYTRNANTEIAKLSSAGSNSSTGSTDSATSTAIPATGDTSIAVALVVLLASASCVCVAMRPARKKRTAKHATK